MIRLTLDLSAIRHNLVAVDRIVRQHGARWTLVSKVLSGWPEVLRVILECGVDSIADSRLENLVHAVGVRPPREVWYLRPPCLSDLPRVVANTTVSLNSDLTVLKALSVEATRQGRLHHVVVMVELGDLREGVSPRGLGRFIESAKNLSGIRLAGIGSNLGCLTGAVPTVDQFSQLMLYRELMRLKFHVKLPLVSAGTSAVLPLAAAGSLPSEVNHFRIGESVFLGTDLIYGGTLAGLRDDALLLEAEIVEVREKRLDQTGEVLDIGPFEPLPIVDTGRPHGLRAIVSLGQLDTAIQGLSCIDPSHRLVGASSDLAVIAVDGETADCKVGDLVKFRPSYGALVRLTASPYVQLVVTGRSEAMGSVPWVDMPPVIDQLL